MSATKKEDEKEKKVDNLSEAQVLKSTGLDDEDEFEEFPIHEAALEEKSDRQVDINIWEDNWDDETIETDFSKQLRDELKRHNFPVAGTTTPMEQDQPEQMT